MRVPVPRTALVIALIGGVLLTGCGSADGSTAGSSPSGSSGTAAGLDVVASTDVWGDVAAVVGGKAVRVTSFINDPGQDPHSFEANPRNQLAVSRADVVIENGGGYDDFMQTLRNASGTKASVIDAVDVSGRTAPAGGELNEHVWYDLPTVAKVADRVAAALGRAEPGKASTFAANAAAFTEQLATLESTEAGIAASASGTGVAITEPVPLYLLQACGLVNRTPEEFSEGVEEGTDVPPTVLAETKALFSDHAVKALVYNEQTSGPETEAVLRAAKAADVAVVPVTETLPDGQDYLAWMTANLAAVKAAVTAS